MFKFKKKLSQYIDQDKYSWEWLDSQVRRPGRMNGWEWDEFDHGSKRCRKISNQI